MSLNSFLFLFLFFPFTLPISYIRSSKTRNGFLLVVSLLFYICLDLPNFPLIVTLILFNYVFTLIIGKNNQKPIIIALVIFNLSILLLYKLFLVDKNILIGLSYYLNLLPGVGKYFRLYLTHLSFPIGLSFFIFQLVSYLLDLYHKKFEPERNLLLFSLYLLIFAKITAGPITRFGDFKKNAIVSNIDPKDRYDGIKRFALGLIKKALIADRLSLIVDNGAFDSPFPQFPALKAWLLIICYTVQIYVDFSAYSDMAIGIGRLFGFKFTENFTLPYYSKSISEFWRRWHISLSSWFREYLFFPLERKRIKNSGKSQSLNILIVFLLTGMWHGLTPNYVIWGLIHGLFVSLEASPLGKKIASLPGFFRHAYTMIVVIVAWVFFRTTTPWAALQFFNCLLGGWNNKTNLDFYSFPPLEISGWFSLFFGMIISIPVEKIIPERLNKFNGFNKIKNNRESIQNVMIILGILLAIVSLAGLKFRGYIYAGF